ncbi:hypothetical protein ETD86_29485 [Nonomuraea turkmeniaca]|uniref:Uncharacterized protein n=1 Tax=Nonomuraea turkmeniaca TaxID=103838 RepID=A0A5S4FB84_9ACTN|nr:hypothetical protein [Nonomuraea turkmeniaca]TMR14081.1 hypothetical protein ETD86_29485 [Nonomuraea turkmeniaca]
MNTAATIAFVPLDADRETLAVYLEDSTDWEQSGTSFAGAVRLYDTVVERHLMHADLVAIPSVRLRAPRDADQAEWERKMCAEAAHRINAHLLGLPYETPRDAVQRLVGVVQWAQTDPGFRYVADIAAGRRNARTESA